MSSSPLVSFVKSRIEYVDLHLKMNIKGEKIDSIANEATAKFIDMIQRSSTLSLPVASEIGALLIESTTFSHDQREAILDEINKRMSWYDEPESPEALAISEANQDQGSPPKMKLQTCLAFYRFMTKKLWAMSTHLDYPITYGKYETLKKLKKLTENTQRLASEDAAKKLQATATTTAKKNAPRPKAKAKGKAGTKKAKAKAKGKSATIKTVNESDSKMSAKKTPGCSKCRYLQNGCKACNPKRFK